MSFNNVIPGWMVREMYEKQTGGLHPESVCGEDCSGCVSPEEGG